MSYRDQLLVEINSKLDDLADAGRPWNPSVIAHAICADHSDGLAANSDTDFWRFCGYAECRDEVRRCINRRGGDHVSPDAEQLTLPGYDHLQQYYVVKRDGHDIGVPVHDLTPDEIASKAALYRSMGVACFAHADELERYENNRAAAPSLFGEAEPVPEEARAQ